MIWWHSGAFHFYSAFSYSDGGGHHVPLWVKLLPIILATSGVLGAYIAYVKMPHLPDKIAQAAGGLYRFLFNKWYFDELYDRIFVRSAVVFGGWLWKRGDKGTIDYFGPDGLSLWLDGYLRVWRMFKQAMYILPLR